MRSKIADTGLLVGALDSKDEHHPWAERVFRSESPPFHVCEAVIAEASAILGSSDELLRMIEVGDLVVSFDLAAESARLRDLVRKYRDRPMDLADACCVRMSELLEGSVVYTVDAEDFRVYRRNHSQVVPFVAPKGRAGRP